MLAKYKSLLFSLTMLIPYKQDVCRECFGCRKLPVIIFMADQETINVTPYHCPYCFDGHEMTIYGELKSRVRQPKDFSPPQTIP